MLGPGSETISPHGPVVKQHNGGARPRANSFQAPSHKSPERRPAVSTTTPLERTALELLELLEEAGRLDNRVWNEGAVTVVPVGRAEAAALLSHLLQVMPEGAPLC
eukprot:jgi/Botrbrau1/4239/Bobra.0044s0034.1